MRLPKTLLSILAAALLAVPAAQAQEAVKPVHGIAMHGEPKYGPDFKHFDYVNPDAPKGGLLRMHTIGSFDSLNPFIPKGASAIGLGLVFGALTTQSADEAFSEYGLIAESIEMPEDRSSVTFNLRPEARWHDGVPITADDVIFSFETLRDKGAPTYRFYYADVAQVEKLSDHKVKFTFKPIDNPELPLILGQLTLLPKHYWEGREFGETTLEPPLGSGPYRVADFEPGRFITYERVADWWGKDLPVNVGLYNFDRIRYDYYRDSTVALEAFKAGEYDYRSENAAKNWATGYEFEAVRDGRVIKETFEHDRPQGMQAFVMNTRRPQLQDRRVREALNYAFDFEWTNQALFFGQYERSESFFENSELAARDLPQGAELELLEKYRGRIPEEVFTKVHGPPRTDGTGDLRRNLRAAIGLLRDAGWSIKDGVLTNDETGEPFKLEILMDQPTDERYTLPFVDNLKRLGIQAVPRMVDSAQYINRVRSFDFDMTALVLVQSDSPGNEQRYYWGSESRDSEGSRNYIGVNDPAIDELIELVITAPDRETLITRVRALDRVLLWNHFVIPQWHIPYDRVAYWNKFGHPEVTPSSGQQVLTWWIKEDKEASNATGKRGIGALGQSLFVPASFQLAQAEQPEAEQRQERDWLIEEDVLEPDVVTEEIAPLPAEPEGAPQTHGIGPGTEQPVAPPGAPNPEMPEPTGTPVTPPGDVQGAQNAQVQEMAPGEAVPMPAAESPGTSPWVWIALVAVVIVIIAMRAMRHRRRP